MHQLILNAALNDEDTIPTPLRAALCTYFGVNAQRVSNWIRLHKNKTKKASQDALPVAALALLPESQASAGGRQEEAAASVVAVARPIVQQGEDDGSETEDEEEAPASDPGPERQRQRRERTHAPAPAVVEPGRRVSTMEALSGKVGVAILLFPLPIRFCCAALFRPERLTEMTDSPRWAYLNSDTSSSRPTWPGTPHTPTPHLPLRPLLSPLRPSPPPSSPSLPHLRPSSIIAFRPRPASPPLCAAPASAPNPTLNPNLSLLRRLPRSTRSRR